ncbi:nucleotidyltransferase domain-containing protein [Leptospira sp. SA-E8]|uniref:nucleotidyltransferase domain-containing protein n=1 Tax=Leptospira sp. SA-E8 TaxID=3422259 RepID=UPI003EBDC424
MNPIMVDERTVEFTHQFCLTYLASVGYRRLVLIGSRARGTARPSSDYDFVAVVSDDAPEEILSGRNHRLLHQFEKHRDREGLSKIDLLVATESRVAETDPTPDEFIPYACQSYGKVVRKFG